MLNPIFRLVGRQNCPTNLTSFGWSTSKYLPLSYGKYDGGVLSAGDLMLLTIVRLCYDSIQQQTKGIHGFPFNYQSTQQ
jgi:hypothetical protein